MSKIDHPSHYNIDGKEECIVAMEHELGRDAVIYFCLCNSFKYNYRAGYKEGESKDSDLQKALWYMDYARKLMGEE